MPKALVKIPLPEAAVSPAPAAVRPPLPAGLIEQLLSAAMPRGGEFAEVYLERAIPTAVTLDERRINSAPTGMVPGVGERFNSGPKGGETRQAALERTT